MKLREAGELLRGLPRNHAAVEITKDRRMYLGTIKKGNVGYLIDACSPPTVYMLTGPVLGQVSMPVGKMKSLGYFTREQIMLLARDVAARE